MSYGKGHRLLEGDMPRVLLQERDETLRYVGERITITDFQIAVNKGLNEAEKLLDQFVSERWMDAAETIDLHRIVDSLLYEGMDQSFATNVKNA
jgi:hypothetical protein